MREAVVVAAARTAAGKRNAALSGWHPAELAAEVFRAVVDQAGIDPVLVDDVLMGCVTQVGTQSTNVARTAVLAAGFPESVPATTIDRQCGSSQQAIHFAAQGVISGAYEAVIAAGVECMSTVPMFSNASGDPTTAYGEVVQDRYADRESYGMRGLIPQGIAAELMADKWGLTREDLDDYALLSQQRAAIAQDEGRFSREIQPVQSRLRLEDGSVEAGAALAADECIRRTSAEALASLKPVFVPNGRVTAGNASQIVDGAAGLLIMNADRADRLGLRARAAIRDFAVVGSDPVLMLDGPIAATRKALECAGLAESDIDLYEVNEAFASVVLAWQQELGVPIEKVNVNGGGISLGHPLGASGAKLMVTLIHELERREARLGLQTMCEGGGMANSTIVERLDS